jgi:hypothetical protein
VAPEYSSESVTAWSELLLDYFMTKGGVHAFSRSIARAIGGSRHQSERSRAGARCVLIHPMKRPAQPEEIAPAYVFLAPSQCSSYITGEIVPIIGGYNGG